MSTGDGRTGIGPCRLGYARDHAPWGLIVVTLESVALALVIVLVVPTALLAAWRIWPRGDDARVLDAIWTAVPPVLIALLVVLAAGAGL